MQGTKAPVRLYQFDRLVLFAPYKRTQNLNKHSAASNSWNTKNGNTSQCMTPRSRDRPHYERSSLDIAVAAKRMLGSDSLPATSKVRGTTHVRSANLDTAKTQFEDSFWSCTQSKHFEHKERGTVSYCTRTASTGKYSIDHSRERLRGQSAV